MNNALLWITAIASVLTAFATLGLVAVGGRTLGGARDQVQLLRQQVEREARPYVVLDVVPGLHGPGSWDLQIRNVGRTMAQQIVVQVDGLEPTGDDDYISEALARYLSAPRSLAPSTGQRVMWRADADTDSRSPQAGASDTATAVVGYTDSDGKPFEEEFDLSTALFGAISPTPFEGPRALGSGKELANVERAIRTLNMHVGELRR